MRFGVCVRSVEDVGILAQAGYDYCELPAASVQPFDDEAAALPALRTYGDLPIPAEAFNLLIPRNLPIVGPEADFKMLKTYLDRAFTRMVKIGGQVAVLGSGGARRIPDEMARPAALDQLAEALSIAGEAALAAGINLVLEPLNTQECNVFNTVAESYEFVVDRDLVGVLVLADLHHMEMDQEPLENVIAAAPMLTHVHVADGGRKAPGEGGYNYSGFMQVLHQANYNNRISAECRWDDLAAQAAGSLKFMRDQWDAVIN